VLAQGATPSLVKDVSIPANAATMGDKAYSPNPVEVKVGGGVTWTNDDSQIHTATSGAAGSEAQEAYLILVFCPLVLPSILTSIQRAHMIIIVLCIH
jgi:hypothetical protein